MLTLVPIDTNFVLRAKMFAAAFASGVLNAGAAVGFEASLQPATPHAVETSDGPRRTPPGPRRLPGRGGQRWTSAPPTRQRRRRRSRGQGATPARCGREFAATCRP